MGYYIWYFAKKAVTLQYKREGKRLQKTNSNNLKPESEIKMDGAKASPAGRNETI